MFFRNLSKLLANKTRPSIGEELLVLPGPHNLLRARHISVGGFVFVHEHPDIPGGAVDCNVNETLGQVIVQKPSHLFNVTMSKDISAGSKHSRWQNRV